MAGLRQARKAGIPVVASYHTDIPGYVERWGFKCLSAPAWSYLRWMHNQATLNLCPGPTTQKELDSHGFENVRVWSRGVDTESFHPRYYDGGTREYLSGGHPNNPLLLFVGRLAPEKQIDSLRALTSSIPGARLAVVGDGPGRSKLERFFGGTPTVFCGYLQGLRPAGGRRQGRGAPWT